MEKKKKAANVFEEKNLGIKLDIGCGGSKQKGFVGMDIRPLPGVDIVHDLEKFPWPIPTEAASFAMSSHVIEHINPGRTDPRLTGLVQLLLAKKAITQKEIEKFIGEPDPGNVFLRFMDEVWRVLKPESQFASSLPYGGSQGFMQDPTHINQRNKDTWCYFDPLDPSGLYYIYRPLPWKIINRTYGLEGTMEVVLEKRRIDKSYLILSKIPN